MNGSGEQTLSVTMLGSFQLQFGEKPIPLENWKSKKALLLLKYLAARYDEKIPSDVLIDLLWPETDFEMARVNLHSAVYQVRKTLKIQAPDAGTRNLVRFSNNLYWLETSDNIFVDLHDFSQKCRDSERLEKEDPEKALAICLSALQLYRGGFLCEDLYEDWTCEIRERSHSQYVELALRASGLLISCQHDFKKAACVCRTALQHEPYREELHQTLIRSLMAMERFPEAVSQYKICAKLLEEEFGLEPSQETKILLQEIKKSASARPPLNPEALPKENHGAASPSAEITLESLLSSNGMHFKKSSQPLTLLTIELDESVSHLHIPEVFSVLAKSLRKGDLAEQWSERLIGIVLQESGAEGTLLVQQRIQAGLGPQMASACHFTSRVLAGV